MVFGFAAFFLAGLLITRALGASISIGKGHLRATRWFVQRAEFDLNTIKAYCMDRNWLYVRVAEEVHRMELTGFTSGQRNLIREEIDRQHIAQEAQRTFGPVGWIVGLHRLVLVFGGAFLVNVAWVSWVAPDLVIGGSQSGAIATALILLPLTGIWLHAELDYRRWHLVITNEEIRKWNWRGRAKSIDLHQVRRLAYVAPLRGGDFIQVDLEDGSQQFITAEKASNKLALRQAIEEETGKALEVSGALGRIVERENLRHASSDNN